MPQKIKDLIRLLLNAGFTEVKTRGKGSHRLFTHESCSGAITLSGKTGQDAKPYQVKAVNKTIEEIGE